MNAAAASFQFTGSTHDFHHSVRSAPILHSSCLLANGSRQSTSGAAPSSRLIHAQPPHSSHHTGTSASSSASRLSSVKAVGRRTNVFAPSSPQHHPWNGQTKLLRDPLP